MKLSTTRYETGKLFLSHDGLEFLVYLDQIAKVAITIATYVDRVGVPRLVFSNSVYGEQILKYINDEKEAKSLMNFERNSIPRALRAFASLIDCRVDASYEGWTPEHLRKMAKILDKENK